MVKLLILNGPPGSGTKKLAQLLHRKLGDGTVSHMRLDMPLRNHVREILGLSEDYLLDGIMHRDLALLNNQSPARVMQSYQRKHLWPMFGIPVLAKWLVKAIWLNNYHEKYELILVPDLKFECELSILCEFMEIAGMKPNDIQLVHVERTGFSWLTGVDDGHHVSGEGGTRELTVSNDTIDNSGMNYHVEIENVMFGLLSEWMGKKHL